MRILIFPSGGGKSPPDRQRRSFVAQGFVAAHSAVPSTKNLEEPNFSTFQPFNCSLPDAVRFTPLAICD